MHHQLALFCCCGRLHDNSSSLPFSFKIGIGARERREDTEESRAVRIQKISGAVRTILECIGEDPNREGLLKTPERYAKALMFFSKGYEESVTRKNPTLRYITRVSCFCFPFTLFGRRKRSPGKEREKKY